MHHNQFSSLPTLWSFDAPFSLLDTAKTLQRPSFKVSCLFLINGGFDNVNASIFWSSFKNAGVSHYMVAWIGSFFSQTICHLLFQGSPKPLSPVQVGTLQGSPISPCLFVIYVASLHIDRPRGLSLSYLDNFALSTASTSYRTNIRNPPRAVWQIRPRTRAREVDFSVPKTQLIHWSTPLQRDPAGAPCPPPICLDGEIFPPLPCV